jgi:eukaryotic-like serine/threonine-protein kinase
MILTAGTRLGAYEIVAPLGEGGMGQVYRARDARLDRDVAIKVLPEVFAIDADRAARFEREAKTLASLNHPNVAAIYGIEGRALVMELVEGEDLSVRIARGPLPVDEALAIARQIAEALEAAHERGIVHRDLKPANVKVRDDGTVKVLDFGLAKALGPVTTSNPDLMNSPTILSASTQLGVILGTASYMSPEQARGRAVDRRADVWAFGVVLYEMLTGRRPFDGDDISSTLANVLKDDVNWAVLPPDLPASVRRILRRSLEKNASKRLNSMAAAVLEIDDALAGSDARDSAPPAAAAVAGRSRAVALAVAVIAALLLGGITGAFGAMRWWPGAARVTEVSYQPITFDTGFVFSARFAHDGRTVVYSGDWEGRARDVFLTTVDTREAKSLGFPGSDLMALGPAGEMTLLLDSVIPAGSPYLRIGDLARSSITGGRTRAELEGVLFADIAPDGTLAVIRRTDTEVLLEFPVGQIVARSPRSINSIGSVGLVSARVSPDGAHVAVLSSSTTNNWNARIFRRGGGQVAEDAIGMTDWWGLAWRSANELWIAGTEAGGRQTRVYALSLSGKRRLVFRAAGALTLHDVSTTGDMLSSFDRFDRRAEFFSHDGASRDLGWQDGAGAVGLADNGLVLLDQDGDGGGPTGSALAWPKGAVHPVRITEGTPQAITPDGSAALIYRSRTLTIVPIGTGQARSIDVGPLKGVSWSGWHPDGRLILDLVRPDASRGTFIVAAGGGTPAALLPPGFRLSGGRLISPDGTGLIASGPDGQLVRCSLPAVRCVALAGRRPGDEIAGWLADNRTVVVVNSRTLPGSVEALDVETGSRAVWRKVTSKQPSVSGIRRLVVAPDGSMLLGYDRSRSELYVIRGLR